MAVWYNLAPTQGRGAIAVARGLAQRKGFAMPPQSSTVLRYTAGVYVIEHRASGMVYVGSSIDIRDRWQDHRYELQIGRHRNRHLQHAWTKYGAAAFEFRVVVVTLPAERRTVEAAVMQTYPRERLYNHDEAIETYLAHSAETRAKIAASNRGKRRSAETRQLIGDRQRGRPKGPRPADVRTRISAALQGHVVSAQVRAQISEAKRGRPHPHTAEAIRKMGDSQRGRPRSPHTAEAREKIRAASVAMWARRRAARET